MYVQSEIQADKGYMNKFLIKRKINMDWRKINISMQQCTVG